MFKRPLKLSLALLLVNSWKINVERVEESVHNGLKLNPPEMLRVRGRRPCQQHLEIFYLCKHDLCHVCFCSVSCRYTFQRSLCCEFRQQCPGTGNSTEWTILGSVPSFKALGWVGFGTGRPQTLLWVLLSQTFRQGCFFMLLKLLLSWTFCSIYLRKIHFLACKGR